MTQNEIATIRGVLATLRAKIRRAWTVRGLSFTAAALCVVVVFSFALDYFLDLPLPVRAVHLAAMVVFLVFVLRKTLVLPLRTQMTDHDLAQAVEHGSPDLRDRLASALDFEVRLGDVDELESRSLMEGVVRDAAAHAARLDPGLLVDSRPARRALGVAAASAAVLAAVAFSAPDELRLWISRGVLLSDAPWPRRTHIRVLDFPAEGPKIVTRGEDLRVVAVATGERPSELLLHYEELADPDPTKGEAAQPDVTFLDTRRMYPVEGEEGRFAFDFRAVSSSFRFWITGGDWQIDQPRYSVLALIAPRVASIAGKIVFPPYAGLPDAPVRESNFEVLTGSHVELSIATNIPVTTARVVPTDGAAPTVLALPADGKSLTLSFDVQKSIDFHLELTASRGQSNRPDDDVFHLRSVEDRPPDLHMLYPPARVYRTPNGVVPIKFVAKDDFQVASVLLDVALGSSPAATTTLWPVEGAPPPAEKKRIDAYRRFDLLQFAGDKGPPLKPTDVVHLAVRAVDSHGNETTSGDLAIEVQSPEEVERRLDQRQGILREDLLRARHSQQRALTAITDLRALVAAGAVEAPALQQGRDLQVDQGRVTNDLGQFLSGIHQVFDSYVFDRVGAGTTIEKLLPLYDEALAAPSDDEVFPESLYKKIVAEKRADRVYDSEKIGVLLDIMDLGDRAVFEASPAVYKSLVDWSSDKAHDPAQLERAEKTARDLGSLLVEIDKRMQQWGEMNLLIEMAREIRNNEIDLSKGSADGKGLAPK